MITIFSWGYFGWGNATDRLVRAVDAVERERGFDPPLFVDTRIRRTVRAVGFQGAAFETLLGPDRHRWLNGLGNLAVLDGEAGSIHIADPSQADALLDLALEGPRRRVIFFCGCRWPNEDGEVACHRWVVGDLLLEAARKRWRRVEVVEWPGGKPTEETRRVEAELLRAVRRGRASIPLGKRMAHPGTAWGSVMTLRHGKDELRVLVGPARYHAEEWELPVLRLLGEEDAAAHARSLRRDYGLEARSTRD